MKKTPSLALAGHNPAEVPELQLLPDLPLKVGFVDSLPPETQRLAFDDMVKG